MPATSGLKLYNPPSFDVIEIKFGLNKSVLIARMCNEMKTSPFQMWRKRMVGRVSKHAALRP